VGTSSKDFSPIDKEIKEVVEDDDDDDEGKGERGICGFCGIDGDTMFGGDAIISSDSCFEYMADFPHRSWLSLARAAAAATAVALVLDRAEPQDFDKRSVYEIFG
jgi:hypothetical protein